MNQRREHAGERKEHAKINPICAFCNCRPTHTVHHIVQKMGGSYEHPELYLEICWHCHDDKIHTNSGKEACIDIQVRRGRWFETEEDERAFFGGRVHYQKWGEGDEHAQNVD